jgi:murein DD-endopeptidase MepM/ murein hydrolase activator NlpD
MLSSKRICTTFPDTHVAHGVAVALALAVGGCSADVTRFDFPSFGLTSKGNETGSLPTPPESVARRDRSFDDAPGAPPRGAGLGDAARGDRLANAPDYAPPPNAGYAPGPDRNAPRRLDRAPPPRAAAAPGESIQVQQGDTLYGIAKRYGVSISALIEVNGLKDGASIKPGQQLFLPAGVPASRVAHEQPAPRRGALAGEPGWEGRHTMKPGESLYGIARQHGVSLAELQRVNGIGSPMSVRAGTVLSVPANRAEPAPARKPPPAAAPRVAQTAPAAAPTRVINATGEQKVASTGHQRSDAEPAAADAAPSKFRWPARGRVIANFGKRSDGSHNDGINIAVPQGTEVHAAEGGRVAYAGNELKGYGNLVLIRHDNGWVSAYAHADQILVKRDDLVRRGQVIARAGKTGTVDQPQLHFELRQGAKPVDPMPHLEK